MLVPPSARRAWVVVVLSALALTTSCPAPSERSRPRPVKRFAATALRADAGDNAFASAVADLDQDGVLDLVLGEPGQVERLSWRAGRWLVDVSEADGDAYFGIAVTDVGGDGRPDVVTASVNGVSVLEQDDAGHLRVTRALPALLVDGGRPVLRRFLITDVTGDGVDDLVETGPSVRLLPGPLTSSALQGPLARIAYDPLGAVFTSAGRRQGRALVVAQPDRGVTWLPWDDGGFGPAVELVDPDAGLVPYDIAAGDVDGDGLEDLVLGLRHSVPQLLRGAPGGGFAPARGLPGAACSSVAMADVDLDGRAEVFVLCFHAQPSPNSEVFVIGQVGDAGVLAPRQLLALDGGVGIGLDVADFTGDGLADVVVRRLGTGDTLWLWPGEGS